MKFVKSPKLSIIFMSFIVYTANSTSVTTTIKFTCSTQTSDDYYYSDNPCSGNTSFGIDESGLPEIITTCDRNYAIHVQVASSVCVNDNTTQEGGPPDTKCPANNGHPGVNNTVPNGIKMDALKQALAKLEGNSPKGYNVPIVPCNGQACASGGVTGQNSGLTIGNGIDLSTKNSSQLAAANWSQDKINYFKNNQLITTTVQPGGGLKNGGNGTITQEGLIGVAAQTFLDTHQSELGPSGTMLPSITETSNLQSNIVQAYLNIASASDAKFANLPASLQIVAFEAAYAYGNLTQNSLIMNLVYAIRMGDTDQIIKDIQGMNISVNGRKILTNLVNADIASGALFNAKLCGKN